MTATDSFVVVTGGPGSGKSTLVDRLHEAGYGRSPEVGREIIRDQVAIGGRALPWVDPAFFAEVMLTWDVRAHRVAAAGAESIGPCGPVFFDRGIIDAIGYLRLERRAVPDHLDAAARTFRYRRQVFVAPPWPAIYATDTERRQSLDTAERTYQAMVEVYPEYGYELVELPRVPVGARAAFMLDALR